jgi:phage terminase large subunit GpA-like protein
MGDLADGDTVFGPDGRPTTVLAAHAVKHGLDCYRVDFSDGTHLVADGEHLWGVERFYWKSPSWRYEVKSTKDLLQDLHYSERADGRKRYRYRVRNTAPIECAPAALPIDPYLFGVWLGDGGTNQAVISSHRDDANHYVTRLEAAGHAAVVSEDGANTVRIAIDLRARLTTHCRRGHEFAAVGQTGNGGCMECSRRSHHHRKHGVPMDPMVLFADTFASRLHAMGVHGNKHIPQAYLRGSAAQRAELLRGLMDTDGCFDRRAGTVEFTTVLPGLAADFCELARSLGFKPATAQKATSWEYLGVRKTGTALRVTFPVDGAISPFSLPRKADAVRFATVDVGYRQIVSITPVETRPVRCIQVDNESHLFLAGEGMAPTHNTMGLLDGWMAHAVTNDPGDMLFVQMTQDKAREFSKTRIDRALRHSDELKVYKSSSAQHDNTHDKMFKHGMWLRIAWPTVSNLSSSDYRYVAFTDYDRMPDDVDGEGAPFTLGLKRTTTFLSRGMCLAESSPGRDVTDPRWSPITAHEAPPTGGILGIYNRSDRRRWYWKCPHCDEYFECAPGLGLFGLPSDDALLEIVREADLEKLAKDHSNVICPHCACLIPPKEKHRLNASGVWLRDGERITPDGTRYGEPVTSTIAGYWMGGCAAAYQSWKSLVMRYLQGLRDYALTGEELTLKTTVNTDQGMPYTPRALVEAAANSGEIKTEEHMERYVVPHGTRFLAAAVDVQGGTNARFIVQVHAVGQHFEQWVVDRFEIKLSQREGMGSEFAPIDPAAYAEDWKVLTEKVVNATYKTPIPGKELRILMTAVDSGGEDGVTDKAYAWWRSLKQLGLQGRVMLVKGASAKGAPMLRETRVGNLNGKSKGDVPLYLLNPNLLKDAVSAGLRRQTPGPGYFHLPGWLPQAFHDELFKSEIRGKDGTWSQVRKRNEALDLACYIRAVCLRMGLDKIKDWDKRVPPWAKPIEQNRELVTREERLDLKADAAASKAPVQPPARRRRRTVASPYLS